MTSDDIRKTFLDFFAKRGYVIVPSSPLVPDDPSVLLTTAGMQQFKKYYTGELDPITGIHPTLGRPLGSYSAASVQKSFRTSDIEEVGDASHLTFFEMLGNFSFGGGGPARTNARSGGPARTTDGVQSGGYFKKEAIEYAHEFITKELGLAISYVTIFKGRDDLDIPKDEESRAIWKNFGISDEKIKEQGIDDVFWGPTGNEGPCGPTTEIYCKNAAGADVEIWNIVFNEYFYPGSREELLMGRTDQLLKKLDTPGVDTGMGLERLAMIVQKKNSVFETDLFEPIFSSIIEIIGDKPIKKLRIIVDHLRAATFLISDNILPSNTGRGYILRRLIRRAMAAHDMFVGANIDSMFYMHPVKKIIDLYGSVEQYKNLTENKGVILKVIGQETERFNKTLASGLKALNKEMRAQVNKAGADYMVQDLRLGYAPHIITGRWLFDFYQSFGFPPELTFEVLEETLGRQFFEQERSGLMKEFTSELKKHQEISRAGVEKKFGGHGLLLDTGELKARDDAELQKVTRLHTATHLLHAALRKILGEGVRQMGSDITADRTRFDFSFDRKLTDNERQAVENLVNDVIQKGYDVKMHEMPYQEATAQGALHFFREKYPELITVYQVDDFSKELCGGPHVKNTKEIGHFKILKEEAVASGVRRIRATVE